jgi:O-antigen ligase
MSGARTASPDRAPLVGSSASSGKRIASLLAAYIVLLLLLPSSMVIGPLGAGGTPASILAVCLLWAWIAGRLHPGSRLGQGPQPVRGALLVFAAAVGASAVAAAFRPIAGVELAALDRGGLVIVGGLGVAFMAADGIADRHQLDRVIGWLVGAATVFAMAGIVQFLFGYDVKTLLKVPGLVENLAAIGIDERSTFRRVSGTAAHPIEFGVVLAMVFPLALHQALYGRARTTLRRWGPLLAISLALPMSLSRSAFVALALVLVVLGPVWPPDRRRRGLLVGVVFAGFVRFTIPGLLGTVKSLFLNLGNDPSIEGRTEDYSVFGRYFSDHPWFGRGLFTFLPDSYTTFDNQLLLSLVEVGVVGTVALLVLFFVGMGSARGARKRSTDPATRHLGQALAASLAGALIAYGTFDALTFSMVTGCTFLILGLAGARWRLARQGNLSPRS